MNNYRLLPVIIFMMNLVLYALFNYGGIRSPDSEIVFRTTQSLVLRNEFSVPEPIDWTSFGLAYGTDGKRYSIFGPTESILAVPMLEAAYYLQDNNLTIDSNYIPISFHVTNGNKMAGLYYIEGKRPPDMSGHYIRFVVSFFNVLIGALSGIFFYFLLSNITKSPIVSFYTTFIYSFGSLVFPYAGTFFSEPLCTMFIILSLLFIVKNETKDLNISFTNRNYFYSGIFLGLAITTHISAVLSVPFYFVFILGQISKEKFNLRRFVVSGLYFILGLVIFGGLLLYYNYIRFGNILETGRSADQLYHYAIYSNPLPALYGLLFSPGKGIFLFSPVIILGIIFWRYFHRQYPHLSIAIIGMILTRLFFIASRSDWHGGFSLGPRYLVIIIPFFFIPIALGLKDILTKRKTRQFVSASLFGFLCVVQQIFFSTGEIFSYLHTIFLQQKDAGIDTLANNSLYLNWQYAPVLYLLNFKRGPFMLKFISTNTYLLWFWMVVFFSIIFSIIIYTIFKSIRLNSSIVNS